MMAAIIFAMNMLAAHKPILFHVAPMQCYTNVHLRVLFRSLSAKAVLWTEMEKARDLCKSQKACAARLKHTYPEHPLVLQLGGGDPDRMAQAARSALPFGFDEININAGCPSIESGGADFGAALMNQPMLTRQLAERVAQACPGMPISVKCRLGVHERLSGAAGELDETYEQLHAFVAQISSSGAVAHVVVHARAAVLSGLSPTQNRRVPPLRPEWVGWLARDFPELRITTNGGVEGIEGTAGVRAIARGAVGAAGVDGAMAGRWLLRRPLDLWHIDAEPDIRAVAGVGTAVRRAWSRADAIVSYSSYADRCLSAGTASAAQLAPPLLLVLEQLREDVRAVGASDVGVGHSAGGADGELPEILAALWDGASTLAPRGGAGERSRSELVSDNDEAMASIQRLGRGLSKTIGTKVANKLSRNRAEELVSG